MTMSDLISREDAIKAVTIAALDDRDELEAIKALPSAEAVEAVKDCRNCRHGGYNDHWKTWFCYNNRECSNWDLWETAEAEPSLKAIKRQIDEQWYLEPPSAEAVQGWIPVEEQPPVFPCLVCDANGNQPSVPLEIVTITDEEHGEWHIDGRLWDTKIFFKGEWCSQTGYGNRIIAWMPLPEPYKGADDE